MAEKITKERIYEISLGVLFLDAFAFVVMLGTFLKDLAKDAQLNEPNNVTLQLMLAVALFSFIGIIFTRPQSTKRK